MERMNAERAAIADVEKQIVPVHVVGDLEPGQWIDAEGHVRDSWE